MEKIHFNAKFKPSTMAIVEKHHQFDDYRSKSEFIEDAIEYYDAYLNANDSTEYLESVIDKSLQKSITGIIDRLGTILFKSTVELDMIMHIIAATYDIDKGILDKLRGMCVEEVTYTNGRINIENAIKVQKK